MDRMQKFFIAFVFAWVVATQAPTIWGGDHIEMQVADAGARLEFDCAHGTIDEPLRADAKGAFKLKGTFTPERSGPTPDGGAAPIAKAIYSGTIKDGTMTLRIVVDGQDPAGRTYELERDRSGNVRKCR
jgi:hypothetical protein